MAEIRTERAVAAALSVLLALSTILGTGVTAAGGPMLQDPATLGLLWQNSTGHNSTLWSVRWSPDGSMLSATYFDNTTVVFNATTGARVVKLGSHPIPAGRCDGERKCAVPDHFPMRCSAWSPDGRYLAMGGDDRLVTIYWTANWTEAMALQGHRGSVLTLEFSPDGRYLASGSGTDKVEMNNANDENSVRIWDVDNSTAVEELRGHRDGVMEVRWSPAGDRLVSTSDDKTVRLYRTSNWSLEGELRGHTLGVLCADFSPDGAMLVTGSRDYTVRLWDLDLGNFSQGQKLDLRPLAKWNSPNCVRSVDWHPGGELISSSGVDETMLSIRNASTGAVLRTFTDSAKTRSAVMSSRWSPDGGCLAAGAGKEAALRVYGFGSSGAAPAGGMPEWVPRFVVYSILSTAMIIVFIPLAWRHMERERR